MNNTTKTVLWVAGGAAVAYFIVLPVVSFAIGTIAGGSVAAEAIGKVAGTVPFTGQIQPKRQPKGGTPAGAAATLLPSNTAPNNRGGATGNAPSSGGITDPGYDAMAPNRYVSRTPIDITARPPAQRA